MFQILWCKSYDNNNTPDQKGQSQDFSVVYTPGVSDNIFHINQMITPTVFIGKFQKTIRDYHYCGSDHIQEAGGSEKDKG